MYICPICNEEFDTEEAVAKHLLKCWNTKNPYHKPKSAPRSEDINKREINGEVMDFFKSFQKE